MTDSMVTTERPQLTRWRWTVTAAFGLGGITVSAWGPRLPAIKADLGIGTATIGLLLAGVTVGAIAGLLASTPVLHRLGSRRAMAAALLLIAAAMTVMGLALILGSVPLAAAAFVVVGMGIGVLDVLINVEGSAVEQTAGRTLMPMMHAAWSIGVAAGAGIGAACAALGISPAAQLIAEAVLIAVAAVGMAPGIPAGNRAPAEQPQQDRAAKLRQWLRGWLDWRLLLIGVVMLGVELGEGRQVTGSPWPCGTVTGRPPPSPRCSPPPSPPARRSPGSSAAPSWTASDASTPSVSPRPSASWASCCSSRRETLDRPGRRGAVGGRRLDGLPARHVRGRRERTRPGRTGQRRRLHRLLRQPGRTTRHRPDRPVRRPPAARCGSSSSCSSPPSPRPAHSARGRPPPAADTQPAHAPRPRT